MKRDPVDIFRSFGGYMRMSEAVDQGITRYMLYAMRDKGVIEQIGRGIFRLAELSPVADSDLVTVGIRYPNAVICLLSALAFHEITTQIPHKISLAIPSRSRVPSLDHPPLSVHKFSDSTYRSGIEEHRMDGVTVKIYSPEKTIADCFKFRNSLGMDVVLEALKLYKSRKEFNLGKLLEYGKICRVERVMRPYLEAIV